MNPYDNFHCCPPYPLPNTRIYEINCVTLRWNMQLVGQTGMTFPLCICFMHFVQITCKSFDVYFSGASVRNIQAFQVLQSVFLKSNSAALCCTILDAISSVYHADNANYFILEGQYTLSQFAEKIHLKPQEIQVHLCPTYHISMCNYVWLY